MRVSKEVKKHMSKLGRKGGKALWLGKTKEEKSKIMSERRIKGLKKSQFLISKDGDYLEEDYLDNRSYRGGKLIKE